MSTVIKEMDEQMRKWVTELDELYAKKKEVEDLIPKLEENVEILKKATAILKSD